jgi:hypothetical protein
MLHAYLQNHAYAYAASLQSCIKRACIEPVCFTLLIGVVHCFYIVIHTVYDKLSDVLVKMLMPNAVWRAGAVAATIRKVCTYMYRYIYMSCMCVCMHAYIYTYMRVCIVV